MPTARDSGARPATTAYLDGGNATWLRAAEMAARLQAGSITHVQGFAVNIANFNAIDVCCAYATEITTELTRLGVPGRVLSWTHPAIARALRSPRGSTSGTTQPAAASASPARSVSAAPTTSSASRFPETPTAHAGLARGPYGTFSPFLTEGLIDGSQIPAER
ncbi:glycoside hydrolase family 6 protein [Streptomyces collinus]|uniref:glycoside hydrolase family 6 protein n=1 Tax=Streptomyces collinus TaxID=42684 RepID=UPI003F4E29AB